MMAVVARGRTRTVRSQCCNSSQLNGLHFFVNNPCYSLFPFKWIGHEYQWIFGSGIMCHNHLISSAKSKKKKKTISLGKTMDRKTRSRQSISQTAKRSAEWSLSAEELSAHGPCCLSFVHPCEIWRACFIHTLKFAPFIDRNVFLFTFPRRFFCVFFEHWFCFFCSHFDLTKTKTNFPWGFP